MNTVIVLRLIIGKLFCDTDWLHHSHSHVETGEVEVIGSSCGGDMDSANNLEPPVIITYTGGTDVLVEGALDVPGATVEVVETDPQPVLTSVRPKPPKKGVPEYREKLLLK